MGPVEGWLVLLGGDVYAVKGCEHPLPCLHVVPKRVGGRRVSPFAVNPRLRRWSRCLASHLDVYCPRDGGVLVDPVEALESRLGSLRDAVVEVLYSAAPGAVGLTGSTLYSERPRDVDIVAYGPRASRRVLSAILDLVAEGVARPAWSSEYGVVYREVGPSDWGVVAAFNPLVFEARGRRYSVKLVSCTDPRPCEELIARSPVRAEATIIGGGEPCTVPRAYEARWRGGRILVYTLRSSLACLPRYTRIEGVFTLEVLRSHSRLVPDGGVVRLRLL